MKYFHIGCFLCFFALTASCKASNNSNGQSDASSQTTQTSTDSTTQSAPTQPAQMNDQYQPPYTGAELDKLTSNPKRLVVFETKLGTIKIQLFDKTAPKHVANIIKLVNDHFFDGTYFHRLIPGFMIQGGDPNTKDDDFTNDGMGQPGQPRVPAEFSALHHSKGILSAARTSDPNSATSQFFLCVGDAGFLDRQYTVYGQVVEGMDVVDKIVELPDASGLPPDPNGRGKNPGKAAAIVKATIQE